MLVLAPSRIPRNALLCSLTILSLATFAHATMPAALGAATRLDESGKIIGIVGGILAIIVSVWGGIFRFVPWLRRRVDAFKSKLIQEAVIQADSQCQIALCDLREMIQKGMKSMRTCAGTAKEQEQLAAAMKETLLSLQRALALVVMGMAGRRPAGTPKEQEQLAAEKREEVRSFMASQ